MKKDSTIGRQIKDAGIPEASHDSARRAIKKILRRSTGRVPTRDLQEIIKIAAIAIV